VSKDLRTEIDPEALRTLRSLVHSIEVSLSGLDERIKRELEVVEVSMALANRARELLNELLNGPRPPVVY
jgi:hypothetical protein